MKLFKCLATPFLWLYILVRLALLERRMKREFTQVQKSATDEDPNPVYSAP